MRGAIPPLPNRPSYRGAQLKHMDKFTFTFRGYWAGHEALCGDDKCNFTVNLNGRDNLG